MSRNAPAAENDNLLSATPVAARAALECPFFHGLMRLTPRFRSEADWGRFGILLARCVTVAQEISSCIYERLDADEQVEFVKWFMLRWAQVDVLDEQEKDEYEKKWADAIRRDWRIHNIGGKPHVLVDLRDPYGYELILDEAYQRIDEGAWLVVDFLNNAYCFKDFLPSEGGVILDAGAYIGDSAMLLSWATHSHCSIHSFEISPRNYDTLLRNITYSGLTTVHPNRLALWAISNARLTFPEARGATSVVSRRDDRASVSTVDTVSIDDYVGAQCLDRVDLIKMDIEAEMEALKGAEETIRKFKPKLAISIYHLWSDSYEIPRLLSQLCSDYWYRFNWYGKRNGVDAILYASADARPLMSPVTSQLDEDSGDAGVDDAVYRCLLSLHAFHEAVKMEHDRELRAAAVAIKRSRAYRVGHLLSLPFRVARMIREDGIVSTVARIRHRGQSPGS